MPCIGPIARPKRRAVSGARRSISTSKELGAVYGEVNGWERPNWYARDGVKPEYEYSYGRQNWFPCAAYEAERLMNRLRLLRSVLALPIFMSKARDALHRAEPHFSANNVDVEPGRIVYTQWLNERGGIEADLTVTRLGENEFMVVTGAVPQTRDMAWLKRHTPEDAHCVATDMTSGLPMIALMGPKSRALLKSFPAPISPTRPFLLAPRKRSKLATPGCAPAASPMSANWAGSFTFPPNSPPMSSKRCWRRDRNSA